MLTDLVILNNGIYGEIESNYSIEERAREIMTNSILELREIQETILLDNIDLDEVHLK